MNAPRLLCFVREKPADLWHVLNSFYPDKPTSAFGYCEEELSPHMAIAIGFRDMGDTGPDGEAGTVCEACLLELGITPLSDREPAEVRPPGETREKIEARYRAIATEEWHKRCERLENELADCHAVSEAYRIDVGRLQALAERLTKERDREHAGTIKAADRLEEMREKMNQIIGALELAKRLQGGT